MKTVIYNSSFIPAEWVLSHGFVPRKITVEPDRHPETEGQCPYAHAFMENAVAAKPAAIVYVTSCDQMRRVVELVHHECPVFLFNMPSTWQTPTSVRLYIQELKRLGRFLLRFGGSFSERLLLESLLAHDEARRRLRELKPQLTAAAFFQLMMAVNEKGIGALTGVVPQAPPSHGCRIALTGSPLTGSHLALFDLIAVSGGSVVLNCCENGEWSLVRACNRRNLRSDPFHEMADAYFSVPEIFRRPNSAFFKRFRQDLDDNAVQGIIVNRYPWCDNWAAEVHRIRAFVQVPVLDLDLDLVNETRSGARLVTRVQAFMEALS